MAEEPTATSTPADAEPAARPAPSTGADERGQKLLELSNAVVRIHKQYYGKGPTKARSHLSHDLLTVLLEGGFTRAEQTLLAHDHADEIDRSRHAMQDAVEDELRAAVEGILGRRIRSFMSANDAENGVQVEVFVLLPEGADDAGAGTLAERARTAKERHKAILDEHRALRAEQVQSRRAVQQGRRERND